jgi:hypothetical protein
MQIAKCKLQNAEGGCAIACAQFERDGGAAAQSTASSCV